MSYQAIYDAVRSKLSNCDVGEAVIYAMRESDISHHVAQVSLSYQEVATEQMRPCVIFRPKVYIDGDLWCAFYGENIQNGVCGFGKSPSDAMRDFDKNWHANLRQQRDDIRTNSNKEDER